uniref:Polyprenyl synthetase n=1 Tax=Chromera velia CCMP2878 TaxID=1169474 RepID=A0A0G4HLL6_9ALVE|eukprot:Cvel_7445.t1-p1 / transcript=Cvel_7445.t1 / gene=Cvel_7445 / organism=Chromera_velia_CCMP2878 / gene_product=Solanesyl-diphosphate synthase 1, mitochondrial, putative / transcript_product=Solanesyl-diphosphate synthase 1, mitochondrial, putative / location=Cvel_scaffold389:32420-35744(+) / protein_length=452 / sequence_SO=supercontig / SO=protein_coding / is_pseudo=false
MHRAVQTLPRAARHICRAHLYAHRRTFLNPALQYLRKTVLKSALSSNLSLVSELKQRLGQKYLLNENLHESVFLSKPLLEVSDEVALQRLTEEVFQDLEAFADGADPFALAQEDIKVVSFEMLDLAKSVYPEVSEVSRYLLQIPGKRVRPLLCVLVNRAMERAYPDQFREGDNGARLLQFRLAELAEMIHTASLMHDDVIDAADKRRGVEAAHRVFDNKKAILGGDFLLARACRMVAGLGSLETCQRISNAVESLARGELVQFQGLTGGGSVNQMLEVYLQKTFYKTAALMAESVCCGAILGGYEETNQKWAFEVGSNFGMAFQLYDDLLDMTSSAEKLGKPAMSDLAAGVATAPLIFSAAGSQTGSSGRETEREVAGLVSRKLRGEGDLQKAAQLIEGGLGLQRTRAAVGLHCRRTLDLLKEVPPGHDGRPNVFVRGLAALLLHTVTRTKG